MKTARRNDVHIEFGSDIASVEKFYRLHMMTRKRQGVPVQPWRFFKNLYRSIIDNDMGFILLAYHQKNCVAGAVFLYWNDILTYKFGASHPNYLSVRPNNLIFSEAIRWGCHHGLRVLDMGKTDCQNKGLRRFKSYWGAHEKPLKYTHFSKSLPKQNHSSVIEASLKLVIRNTPLFMTRCLGELFYKDFA